MGIIAPQLYFAAAPPHDFTPVGPMLPQEVVAVVCSRSAVCSDDVYVAQVECYETSMQSDKVRFVPPPGHKIECVWA